MIFVPSEECFGTLCEDYVVHFQIKFGKCMLKTRCQCINACETETASGLRIIEDLAHFHTHTHP